MDTALAGLPVIDVDTHFTEPPDFWTSRAPAALRDRAPRMVTFDDGVERWVADADTVLGPVGYCVVRQDGSKVRGTVSLDTFAELHAAASNPIDRLRFMDGLGVVAQVLYPNVLGFTGSFVMNIADNALRSFCITGYNDGAAELAETSGGRLLPMAVLPLWNVQESVAELVRCHEKLGLKGVVLSDSPEAWGLPNLGDVSWDPLWSEAEQRGMPVNFHIGGGGPMGNTWDGMSTGSWIASMSMMTGMGNMRCLVNLLFSGVLDRFPTLNFVLVESGAGWLPFMLTYADYQAVENGVTDLELKPSEYFRRQVYASYWFEESIAPALDALGEDNLMFETDFPHPTCLYPAVREKIQESLAGIDPRVQRKVLYETAARLYGIDLSLLSA